MCNLPRLLHFLAYRRAGGHRNKIETNVWESAKNQDVILACKVIALMCDQVVYSCLTAVSAGAVPIERVGAFSDLLEQVLNSPQAIVQRKNMLEQF